MPGIQGSTSGSLYSVEKASPATPITKKEDNNQQQPDICNTPQISKKSEVPYPLLTGIEEQLDQSFKDFKGTLKEAKEKSSMVFQSTGDDSGSMGIKSGMEKGKDAYLLGSMDVKIEGKDVARLSSIGLGNETNSSSTTILPSQTKVIVD